MGFRDLGLGLRGSKLFSYRALIRVGKSSYRDIVIIREDQTEKNMKTSETRVLHGHNKLWA